MIVELRGINTRNKGAELMLRALVDELGGQHRLAVEPRAASYDERLDLGLHVKVGHWRFRERWTTRLHGFLPARSQRNLTSRYGFIFEPDVDAIVDASGFSYSDQFALEKSATAAEKNERAKRAGKPVVLMPQAFGPFTDDARRRAFVRIVEASDLVYAREPASLKYARESGAPAAKLRLAPDFTCLLDGELPADFSPPERLALLVPSRKILTDATEPVRAAYLPFMAEAGRQLTAAGFDVRLLVHERNDVETVEELRSQLSAGTPVLRYENALHLKGIIGASQILVGSRFHALVSALTQGVPSLGVGWSHKYEMLFADYGCEERVVDPQIGADALAEHLAALTEEPARGQLVASLLSAADAEKAKARTMWGEVHAVLAGAPLPATSPLIAV